MDKLIQIMEQRVLLLKRAIKVAEKEKKTLPEGRLRISKSKNQMRYYEVPDDYSSKGSYISVKNLKYISKLAQKDYNRQFLKQANKDLKNVEMQIKCARKGNAESIYTNLSSERQNLVTPYIIPDYLYAKEWQSQSFRSNPYMPENIKYDTRRGEKVRSKSEAILADMLYDLGIPYHYEKPLIIDHGIVRYPDFTVLKVKTREEIYVEHFGLLEDEEYRRGCLNKLDEYRRNGIYPGKNLIFTYETSDNPLDIKGIKEMLEDILGSNR